jgi:thiamine pyrophosphate-dependent acetolactate synthase large subunit-like protein
MNGGEALARCLAAAGIREIFGVPAGKLAPFMRAVSLAPEDFRWTGVRHESAAAWMAAACYRATGSLAVCCGESGPGSHNLVGGLGSAYNNNVPLLVIVSGVPRHVGYPFAGLAMETDNERLLAACTKWTAVVRAADGPARWRLSCRRTSSPARPSLMAQRWRPRASPRQAGRPARPS